MTPRPDDVARPPSDVTLHGRAYARNLPMRHTAVGRRSRSSARMATVASAASPFDPRLRWALSLGSGAPGIALLHIERAHTGEGSRRAAQDWLATITQSGPPASDHDSLFYGAPAVAYVLHCAAHQSYRSELAALDARVEIIVRARLDAARKRMARGLHLPKSSEFDLVDGLTGLGLYLMLRQGDCALLHETLDYLVALCRPVSTGSEILPGWWAVGVPAQHLPAPEWDAGHANLGLAHGIAGPLALLSAAMRRGITVSGHQDAISEICCWYDQWQIGTGRHAWWPSAISRDEFRDCRVSNEEPGVPSWAGGMPGILRAQQLAAFVLNDNARQSVVEEALLGLLSDDVALSRIRDASLGTGWAGLILTLRRISADSSEPALLSRLSDLDDRLSEHLLRCGRPSFQGLLDGEAGIRMVEGATSLPITNWAGFLLVDG